MNDDLINELVKREVERTRTHEDPVIQRALSMLNDAINPVQVVDPAEIVRIYEQYGIRPARRNFTDDVIAFRAPTAAGAADPNIYVNRSSAQYKTAKRDPWSALKLAATLAHEQTHNTERGIEGERAARRIEADFIRSRAKALPNQYRKSANEYVQALDGLAKRPKGQQ